KRDIRQQHLAEWCNSTRGDSSLHLAQIISDALHRKAPADWSKLTISDYRRAAKLKLTGMFGQAYHFDPLLPLKRLFFRDRYATKSFGYQKSIKPSDVAGARKS